jgi:hypothetical protein
MSLPRAPIHPLPHAPDHSGQLWRSSRRYPQQTGRTLPGASSVKAAPNCAASGRRLIKIFLETRENIADLLGLAQIRDGIGDRVMIFKQQQRPQFFPAELFHPDTHIMRQHKIKENPLLTVEMSVISKSQIAK